MAIKMVCLCNGQTASVLHETKALLSVEPDRIGHGTFLIPELAGGSELADVILAAKIPIGKYFLPQNALLNNNICGVFFTDYISTLFYVLCIIFKLAFVVFVANIYFYSLNTVLLLPLVLISVCLACGPEGFLLCI